MCSAAFAENNTFRAYTENGKEIILFENGTWQFPEVDSYQRPKSSKKLVKGKSGLYGIWINDAKWKIMKNTINESAEYSFKHENGDAYGMIIAERIQMSSVGIRDVAVAHIKEADPDAEIILEENRIINGNDVLCLLIAAKVQSIQIIYYYYFYSGDAGTIQLITYTGQNLFEEYAHDLTSFLNGFVILKP